MKWIIPVEETEYLHLSRIREEYLQGGIICYKVKSKTKDNYCALIRVGNVWGFTPLKYRSRTRFNNRRAFKTVNIVLESKREVIMFENLLEMIGFMTEKKAISKSVEKYLKEIL